MTELTIGIPTFNRAERLQALLLGLAPQMDRETELLVVDNSPEGRAPALPTAIDRVEFHRNPSNIGMVRNWNRCIELAKSDWVCVVHDDDSIGPRAISAIREAINLFPEAGLIMHSSGWPPPTEALRAEYFGAGRDAVMHSSLCPSGAVIRRDLVKKLGYFDPRYAYSADIEFFARWAAGAPMVIIKSPQILTYNLHEDNGEYKTWRRDDFLAQLLEIEGKVADYSGLAADEREALRSSHIAAHMKHILKHSWRIGDRRLLRRYSLELARMADCRLKARTKALAIFCLACVGIPGGSRAKGGGVQ